MMTALTTTMAEARTAATPASAGTWIKPWLRAEGVLTTDAFLGDAALRPCWTRERLLAALSSLPEGVVELMCHPGYAPTHARTSFAAASAVLTGFGSAFSRA